MNVKLPIQNFKIDNTNSINTFKNQENNNEVSFYNFLNEALSKVNDLQNESAKLNEAFAAGKIDNIHQVMIAAEKAEIAMQFTMQIRNKIIDAYNEIMRMPI